MRIAFFKAKLSKLILVICALIMLGIYYLDVRNDYYFYTSKKQTGAVIKELKRVEEHMPFVLTLSYYNDYLKQDRECIIKLDGHYGGRLNENLPDRIQIFYTKQRACDVYIIDYKYPTASIMVLRMIIFIILFLALIIFTKQLFSKEKPNPARADL